MEQIPYTDGVASFLLAVIASDHLGLYFSPYKRGYSSIMQTLEDDSLLQKCTNLRTNTDYVGISWSSN